MPRGQSEKPTTAYRPEWMSSLTSWKSLHSISRETYHLHHPSAPRCHREVPASTEARHPAYHRSVTPTRLRQAGVNAAAIAGASRGGATKYGSTAGARGVDTRTTVLVAAALILAVQATTAARVKKRDGRFKERAQAIRKRDMWKSSRNRKSASVAVADDDERRERMNDGFHCCLSN